MKDAPKIQLKGYSTIVLFSSSICMYSLIDLIVCHFITSKNPLIGVWELFTVGIIMTIENVFFTKDDRCIKKIIENYNILSTWSFSLQYRQRGSRIFRAPDCNAVKDMCLR